MRRVESDRARRLQKSAKVEDASSPHRNPLQPRSGSHVTLTGPTDAEAIPVLANESPSPNPRKSWVEWKNVAPYTQLADADDVFASGAAEPLQVPPLKNHGTPPRAAPASQRVENPLIRPLSESKPTPGGGTPRGYPTDGTVCPPPRHPRLSGSASGQGNPLSLPGVPSPPVDTARGSRDSSSSSSEGSTMETGDSSTRTSGSTSDDSYSSLLSDQSQRRRGTSRIVFPMSPRVAYAAVLMFILGLFLMVSIVCLNCMYKVSLEYAGTISRAVANPGVLSKVGLDHDSLQDIIHVFALFGDSMPIPHDTTSRSSSLQPLEDTSVMAEGKIIYASAALTNLLGRLDTVRKGFQSISASAEAGLLMKEDTYRFSRQLIRSLDSFRTVTLPSLLQKILSFQSLRRQFNLARSVRAPLAAAYSVPLAGMVADLTTLLTSGIKNCASDPFCVSTGGDALLAEIAENATLVTLGSLDVITSVLGTVEDPLQELTNPIDLLQRFSMQLNERRSKISALQDTHDALVAQLQRLQTDQSILAQAVGSVIQDVSTGEFVEHTLTKQDYLSGLSGSPSLNFMGPCNETAEPLGTCGRKVTRFRSASFPESPSSMCPVGVRVKGALMQLFSAAHGTPETCAAASPDAVGNAVGGMAAVSPFASATSSSESNGLGASEIGVLMAVDANFASSVESAVSGCFTAATVMNTNLAESSFLTQMLSEGGGGLALNSSLTELFSPIQLFDSFYARNLDSAELQITATPSDIAEATAAFESNAVNTFFTQERATVNKSFHLAVLSSIDRLEQLNAFRATGKSVSDIVGAASAACGAAVIAFCYFVCAIRYTLDSSPWSFRWFLLTFSLLLSVLLGVGGGIVQIGINTVRQPLAYNAEFLLEMEEELQDTLTASLALSKSLSAFLLIAANRTSNLDQVASAQADITPLLRKWNETWGGISLGPAIPTWLRSVYLVTLITRAATDDSVTPGDAVMLQQMLVSRMTLRTESHLRTILNIEDNSVLPLCNRIMGIQSLNRFISAYFTNFRMIEAVALQQSQIAVRTNSIHIRDEFIAACTYAEEVTSSSPAAVPQCYSSEVCSTPLSLGLLRQGGSLAQLPYLINTEEVGSFGFMLNQWMIAREALEENTRRIVTKIDGAISQDSMQLSQSRRLISWLTSITALVLEVIALGLWRVMFGEAAFAFTVA